MEKDVEVKSYIVKFGMAYTIGLIALSAIFQYFDLDHSTGASIGVLLGAAMYAVGKFIQDNKRIPSKKEKSKMVWTSFLISWVVSILLLVAIVLILGGGRGLGELAQLAEELNITIITGSIIFVSLLYLAVLYYSYGGLAQKQYEGLKKKGKL